MSNFLTFTPVVHGVPGSAPRHYYAATPDTSATVLAANYVNDLGKKVKVNDRFTINTSVLLNADGSIASATLKDYFVNGTPGAYTLAIYPPAS